jgi:hypothetical protein
VFAGRPIPRTGERRTCFALADAAGIPDGFVAERGYTAPESCSGLDALFADSLCREF